MTHFAAAETAKCPAEPMGHKGRRPGTERPNMENEFFGRAASLYRRAGRMQRLAGRLQGRSGGMGKMGEVVQFFWAGE